ncbi:MAG TPA: FecR domain-containing protein [Flavisolibacter sp.]|nr:FecR domain-containing protein [Flavisolibacter sp.]
MNENYNHINDELLVSYLLNEASAAERAVVEQWIAAGEDNRLYFDQLRLIWEESKKLASASTADEDQAWKRFKVRVGTQKPDTVPVRRMGWLRIAALFVLISGAGLLGYMTFKKAPAVEQLVARAGNTVRSDTLPDGSIITLNKNSELAYPSAFEGESRQVSLRGEAFFHVKSDKSKPFLISVNDVTVRVVGTSFNIKSENGRTEVIVETGIVRVTKQKSTVELRQGEKLVVNSKDTALVKQKETEALYNYYRTREFVCDNTPLWKLVEVLNEAYGVNITIERPETRNLPLDVTFSNESLDRILEVISMTFNLSITRSKDKISLR